MPVGIEILLSNGDPNGLKIITISGWNGKAFLVPRAKLNELKGKDEAQHPALYFLFGEGEDPSRPRVYIGESETFYQRVASHDGGKDFWSEALIFTGRTINRAHVKYLESQSIRLAKEVNRADIQNAVEPGENRLTEFEKAGVYDYFEKVKIILGLFGMPLLQELPKKEEGAMVYYFNTEYARGAGILLGSGEFLVFEGSAARKHEAPSFAGRGGSQKRAQMVQDGILSAAGDESYVFTKDHIFRTPSAAGDAVAGRSVNGWTAWKDAGGVTLDDNVRK